VVIVVGFSNLSQEIPTNSFVDELRCCVKIVVEINLEMQYPFRGPGKEEETNVSLCRF